MNSAIRAKRPRITPSLAAIRAARKLLARQFAPTRLVAAPYLSEESGERVFLKLETELPTSSFKVRGALWALAMRLKKSGVPAAARNLRSSSGFGSPEIGPPHSKEKRTGLKTRRYGAGTPNRAEASTTGVTEVIASSTGNHGAAVAYAAKLLGVKARIFLPTNCNPVKRARILALGAEIVESGGADLAAAFELASEYAKRSGVYFLNDATDADLPAGPATIGMEILEQLPKTNAILVPMGDTALIRGIAAATKQLAPRVRIVGVQAERAPSYYLSWKEHRVVETDTCDTIADGLATRTPDAANVRDIGNLVDDIVLVTEDEMLRAVATLLFEEHVLAEPSGAASTAALLKAAHGNGENVVLVVSGANISRDVLKQAVNLS